MQINIIDLFLAVVLVLAFGHVWMWKTVTAMHGYGIPNIHWFQIMKRYGRIDQTDRGVNSLWVRYVHKSKGNASEYHRALRIRALVVFIVIVAELFMRLA